MKKVLFSLLFLSACANAEVVPLGAMDLEKDWAIPMYYEQKADCNNAQEVAVVIPDGDSINERIDNLQENAQKLNATFIKFNNPEMTSAIIYRCTK